VLFRSRPIPLKSTYLGRNLDRWLGRAYLGDSIATFVSAMGGGTPQTTYAENKGVMAITRVFSSWNFVMAASIASCSGSAHASAS
jgi:putative pyrimidine permease RutG